jgi:hypothetical protein
MSACELRTAVWSERHTGIPRLSQIFATAHLGHGIIDLGAGLYARATVNGEERWFATELSHEAATALLDISASDEFDDAIGATLWPDPMLGVTVVQLSGSHPSLIANLDRLASRALAGAMALEIIVFAHSCDPYVAKAESDDL